MAVESRTDGSSVRIHVGGLKRGVRAEDLAALIGRAFPDGAGASAEIMRDSETGIERGFGFVTVSASGEEAKAGAEHAIEAFNGTRWKGSRIKVGLAKGNYLERLACEREEAKAKAQEEQSQAVTSMDHSSYKPRPYLRLRRKPGERAIMVDPTPIAWTKPTRPQAGWQKKKEEAKGGGGGGEQGEAERHRRKRGVWGGRRRVVFPGREATCSTKCREIWRKHLQERAAETSAARLRSVDRLISGKGAVDGHGVVGVGAVAVREEKPSIAASKVPVAEQEDDGGNEFLPVDVTEDLAMVESTPPDGIEFVWDDSEGQAAPAAGNSEDELEGESEEDEDDDLEEEEEEEEVSGVTLEENGRGVSTAVPASEGRKSAGEGRGKGGKGRSLVKKLERLGNNHGLELDDRLAELLSDEEEEEDVGEGGYDYELETADKAGVVFGSGGGSGPGGVGRETAEHEKERLQAETERSLSVLAEMFGGGSSSTPRPAAGSSDAAPKAAPDDTEVVRVDEERTQAPSGHDLPSTTGYAEGVEEDRGRGLDGTQEQGTRDGTDSGTSEGGNNNKLFDVGGKEVLADAMDVSAKRPEERFVAHMSTLTDIFKVEDKVSTKKNQQEKEKDKGFRVASLFGEDRHTSSASTSGSQSGGVVVGGELDGGASKRVAGEASFSFGFGGEGLEGRSVSGDATTAVDDRNDRQHMQHETSTGTVGPLVSASSGGVDGVSSPAAAVEDGNIDGSSSSATTPRATVAEEGVFPNEGVVLWRPLGDVVAVGARFVRAGKREDVEASWLGERKALTQDFKRKHKDALKGRRGRGAGGTKHRRG